MAAGILFLLFWEVFKTPQSLVKTFEIEIEILFQEFEVFLKSILAIFYVNKNFETSGLTWTPLQRFTYQTNIQSNPLFHRTVLHARTWRFPIKKNSLIKLNKLVSTQIFPRPDQARLQSLNLSKSLSSIYLSLISLPLEFAVH